MCTKNRVGSNCADELRRAISGRVALPGDELYDEGCRVWNAAVRRSPAIIAFCKQAEDVQAAATARSAAPAASLRTTCSAPKSCWRTGGA
jgi:hypothetical protein